MMNWFAWTGTVAVWVTFVYQIRGIIRFRRERRIARDAISTVVDETGLSPLQVQVAMDAAMATFNTRVAEMREANRG